MRGHESWQSRDLGCSCRFPLYLIEARFTLYIWQLSVAVQKITYPQGRRELGGGPGQIFFRGSYFKKFSGKIFFRTTTPPRRQLFREKFFQTSTMLLLSSDFTSIFHTKFRYFAQKTKYLTFCAEIFLPKKWLGPNKKFLGAPRTWGPGAICPPDTPPPPYRRPSAYPTRNVQLSETEEGETTSHSSEKSVPKR